MPMTRFYFRDAEISSRATKPGDASLDPGTRMEVDGRTYEISAVSPDPATGDIKIGLRAIAS
ncbi:hypothetical protein GCM10011394_28010 [Luteimonas terricola]|uniref:Head-tail adaptor protein n=1 Tax=Luteimonas terricola TaxID=645597 RepID=A0ABQ2EME4_9GAMM|nr:hypothetical protein GCM10011394_28010 [Luteimonas terricola]